MVVVFPTPVGVVRRRAWQLPTRIGLPHARGGGPRPEAPVPIRIRSSPRPWGWSADQLDQLPLRLVFPTPVGVVRFELGIGPQRQRLPHTRGGGPPRGTRMTSVMTSSPRPWGWSAAGEGADPRGAVFPTPVGVVRRHSRCRTRLVSLPHARGGGPRHPLGHSSWRTSSPRPWGWSAAGEARGAGGEVFPTPVGVVRTTSRPRSPRPCLPHARGGGPGSAGGPLPPRASSPRPWGWSATRRSPAPTRPVFPTPVGVVRDPVGSIPAVDRLPHARGGGPPVVGGTVAYTESSPRPWGWSGCDGTKRKRRDVFPTPVGVVLTRRAQARD